MRKLSPKWPVWLTLLVFLRPVFYIFHAANLGTFSTDHFLQKLVVAVATAIIIWLIYGVACLLAKQKQ